MKEIKQNYKIKAPIEAVWQALVDPEIIKKWSGEPAKMSEEKGYHWEMWGGSFHGENLVIEKPTKLVQSWRDNGWPEGDYSEVTFALADRGDETTVDLTHKNVPDKYIPEIEQGWKDYYLGQIQKLLES